MSLGASIDSLQRHGRSARAEPIRFEALENVSPSDAWLPFTFLTAASVPIRTAMPRAAKPSGKSRHDPLHVQLGEDEQIAKYGKLARPGKRRKSQAAHDDDEENGEVCRPPGNGTLLQDSQSVLQAILDPKTSRKIFELARDQQAELEDSDEEEEAEEEDKPSFTVARTQQFDEDEDDLGEYDENEEEEVEEIVRSPWLYSRLLTT